MSNENEELVRLVREARAVLSEIPLNAPNTLGLRAADLGGRMDAAALSRSASGPSEEEVDAALYIVRLVEQRQVDANAKGVMVARAVLRMAGKP